MIYLLKIGDSITLEPMVNVDGETYRCKLVEIKNDRLYIDYPVNAKTGKSVFLMNGSVYRGSFLGQGKDSSIYLFDTYVIGREKQNIPVIVLSYPGEDHLTRIQRRQFVRVDTYTDVAIHPRNSSDFKPFVSTTKDISAGGASIILLENQTLPQEKEFDTVFVLQMLSGEYHYLSLSSKVIRVIDGKKGERKKVSIEFINIGENERQIIFKYCFDQQLSLRKKGLSPNE
ncbi:flagellar brake domain-containing protein [Bacillus timonensis]|nr:flagellar brake domain-containing protein [Bacillus timonensis]